MVNILMPQLGGMGLALVLLASQVVIYDWLLGKKPAAQPEIGKIRTSHRQPQN